MIRQPGPGRSTPTKGASSSHGTIGGMRFSRENTAGGPSRSPRSRAQGRLSHDREKKGADRVDQATKQDVRLIRGAWPYLSIIDTSQSSSIPAGELAASDGTSMGDNGGIGHYCQSARGLIGNSRVAGLIGGNNVSARPGKASLMAVGLSYPARS